MGLDMYLNKKTYIRLHHSHRNVNVKLIVEKDGKQVDLGIENSKLESITEECMYWRKANMIHKWFVDTVQDGEDNCGSYSVSIEQLKELHQLCSKIIDDESKAEECLPSQEGFFFGGTHYDEYYFDAIKYTHEELTKIISNHDSVNGFYLDYSYSSSW
tara:strand:- start:449 stop:922 length:474 start_codon:yes stop_codon:yes gene_type:complete